MPAVSLCRAALCRAATFPAISAFHIWCVPREALHHIVSPSYLKITIRNELVAR
jgi:hypothetical protein